MSDKFEVGDHVQVGEGKVHWMVQHEYMIRDSQYLILVSPMSGRRNGSFADQGVTLIKKAVLDHYGRPV